MKKEIPFYKSSGLFCAQACMLSVLKYFFPKKNFSLGQLAKDSHKRRNGATASIGIVLGLDKNGLKAKLFTKDISAYHKIEKSTGKYYKKYALSDNKRKKLLEKTLKKKLIIERELSIGELKGFLRKHYLIITLINWNTIKNRREYIGHYVPITRIDNYVYFHNVGPNRPKPNYKVSWKKFVEAWKATGTDSDAIIIFGKKEKKTRWRNKKIKEEKIKKC